MENNKIKEILLLLVIHLLFPFFTFSGNIIHKDRSIAIENGAIRFKFDTSTGAITAFTDLANTIEVLDVSNSNVGSIWEITLEKNSVVQKLDISKARTFHFSKVNEKSIILEWSNFSALSNSSFKVTVNVKVDDNEPFSQWHIAVLGMLGEKLSKVAFPKIEGITDMRNEELAIPSWMGELIKNHRGQTGDKPKTYAWSYPGPMSMQFLALYNKQTHGLYAAANDTMNYVKQFALSVDSLNDLSYQMNNYPSFDEFRKVPRKTQFLISWGASGVPPVFNLSKI